MTVDGPNVPRSLPARVGLVLCALAVLLNALLVAASLIPEHVLLPDAVSMTLFALPLLLAVGMMFFGHVRAWHALNRVGGSSSERKAANRTVVLAITSQVSPRWRPSFIGGCLLAFVISVATMQLGPSGQPTRHGNVYLLNQHGSYTKISETQYHFDAAMWQASFAAGDVIMALFGCLVFLASPGGPPRAWPQEGQARPPARSAYRYWPLRQAEHVVAWIWPHAKEDGALRRLGPPIVTGLSLAYVAAFSYSFAMDWLGE